MRGSRLSPGVGQLPMIMLYFLDNTTLTSLPGEAQSFGSLPETRSCPNMGILSCEQAGWSPSVPAGHLAHLPWAECFSGLTNELTPSCSLARCSACCLLTPKGCMAAEKQSCVEFLAAPVAWAFGFQTHSFYSFHFSVLGMGTYWFQLKVEGRF